MAEKKLPPIISFTSGKGGCGKTTIAVNFAYSVFSASQENKVLVIDFDISNRGSTGIFSQWMQNVNESLTLTRILKNEHKDFLDNIIQIKEGYYFVPATSNSEEIWKDPGFNRMNDFVEELRKKIYDVAAHLGVDCVVLDCFCGIDVLTTSGSASADHTIIVNEPDIVTFTGSLSLKAHLDRSFRQLKRTPELHFVINRVRSDQKVEELNQLYKDNLMQEVKNAILTYIPYNNKIFNNFGSYPFFAEILPRSLFSQKIDQIAFVLFLKSHPKLVRPKVRRWTERKFRKIYLKSIDKSAVDTEYLIVKLISVPVMIGLLVLTGLILASTFRLKPHVAWALTLLLTSIAVYIYFMRLITTTWILARLHFTLANFLYRLGLKSRFREMRLQEIGKTILPFISGLLILTSILFITSIGIYLTAQFAGAMFRYDNYARQLESITFENPSLAYYYMEEDGTESYNSLARIGQEYRMIEEAGELSRAQNRLRNLYIRRNPVLGFFGAEVDTANYLSRLKNTRFVEVSFEFPLRQLQLDSTDVVMINFLQNSKLFNKSRYRYSYEFNERVSYKNTRFEICNMPYSLLDDTVSHARFDYCMFKRGKNDYTLDVFKDQYVHSELKSIFTSFSHIASGGYLDDVTIRGLWTEGIFFESCELNEVDLILNSRNFVAFANCRLNKVRIRLMESSESDTAFVFIPDSLAGKLDLDPRIKVYRLAQFKERAYNDIFQYMKVLDREIDLYENIRSFENTLRVVSDKSRSFKNLTELYMMTYDTAFYPVIENYLDSLDYLTQPLIGVFEIESNEVNWADRGIYHMLATSFAILKDPADSVRKHFGDYHRWIYEVADPTVTQKLNLWDFGMWNQHMLYNSSKLSKNQIELFNLLQDMAFSEVSAAGAWNTFMQLSGASDGQRTEEKIDIILKMSYEKERIKELEQIKQSYFLKEKKGY